MEIIIRRLLGAALLFTVAFPVFADTKGSSRRPEFSLSAGGGGLMGGLFTRYTLKAEGLIEGNQVDLDSDQSMNQFNFGGFVFFDATYGEFSVSVQSGLNNFSEGMSATSGSDFATKRKISSTGREVMLGLVLLGKFPFTLRDGLTLFPLLGVEYQFALMERRMETRGAKEEYDRTDGIHESDSEGEAYRFSHFNSLFIDLGAGLDVKLLPALFLRTELLYCFRLPTPFELDALRKVKKWLHAEDPDLGGLTSGPTLRVALGYRLK
jgi:hypothetical protein